MLEWTLKYGKQLGFFENLEQDGIDISKFPALLNQPHLYDDLVDDFNIFLRLSIKRPIDSMSGFVGAIPYSEIEAYMRIHGIDDNEARTRLIDRIEYMDRIYREYYNK